MTVAATHGLAHGHTWELAKMFVELSDRLRGVLVSESENLTPIIAGSAIVSADNSPWCQKFHKSSVDRQLDQKAITTMFEQMNSLAKDDAAAETCHTYRAMLDEIAALRQDYASHCEEQERHIGSLFHL